MVFEEKLDNHVRYSKYRGVSFLKQFEKFFFHLIEHAVKSLLVFEYLWLILGKSKITAGDTLNSRLSIYAPKNDVIYIKNYQVEKDVIYIKKCSRGRLNLPGEAGQFASKFI